MSIKVETLKAGDVLYDVHSEQAGNTTMRREGCWLVSVREVGITEKGTPYALLSWNGNTPRPAYETAPYKRWPKEWLKADPWDRGTMSGPSCAICRGRRDHDGHAAKCEHPRAIAARKRLAKEQAR